MMKDQAPVSTGELRKFGLVWGGMVLGLWLLYGIRKGHWIEILSILGGLGILAGIAFPRALFYPYKGWMKIGALLGSITSRVMLGVLFIFVVTPVGLLMRAFKKDSLHLAWYKNAESYYQRRTIQPPEHFPRMF